MVIARLRLWCESLIKLVLVRIRATDVLNVGVGRLELRTRWGVPAALGTYRRGLGLETREGTRSTKGPKQGASRYRLGNVVRGRGGGYGRWTMGNGRHRWLMSEGG